MVRGPFNGKVVFYGSLLALLVLLVACGTAATPTPVPPTATTAPEATTSPEATAAPQPTEAMGAADTPMPTTAPQATQAPSGEIVSAKDQAVAVVGSEPERLFWMSTADAHTTIVTEQMTYYIGHLNKDTLAGSRPPRMSGSTICVRVLLSMMENPGTPRPGRCMLSLLECLTTE
jgi:hypothetical protein